MNLVLFRHPQEIQQENEKLDASRDNIKDGNKKEEEDIENKGKKELPEASMWDRFKTNFESLELKKNILRR